MKKMAMEENVHISTVFWVITRFRKEFSVDRRNKKIADQEQGTKPWTRGMQVLQAKSHVSRNVMLQNMFPEKND